VCKPVIAYFVAISTVAATLAQPALPMGVQKSGYVDVGRNESKTAGVEATSDTFTGVFQSIDYTNYTPPQLDVQGTTIGPCNIVTIGSVASLLTAAPLPSKLLDAGPVINLNGPNGTKQIPLSTLLSGYFSMLGGGTPLPFPIPGAPTPTPLYLDPGTYTVDNGSGGADVGPFTTTLTVPDPLLVWTNADNDLTIDRSAGVDIQWTGGDSSTNILIYGVVASAAGGTGFSCTVPNNGEFMVTSDVLSLMPATPGGPKSPGGISSLKVSSTTQTTLSASGLDIGEFSYTLNDSRNVVYQ